MGAGMKRIIVVTGASSGLGKEFVLQISKKEKVDEIWAIARRTDRLEELNAEVNVKVVPLSIDLSDGAAIKAYKDKLEAEKPEIVILANCAGYGKFGHYETIPTETHINMINLNCESAIYMTDYSLPYMKEGAKIMNVASCAGFQPIPYINIYGATKAFMVSYTRALNCELKYRKIHVLALCPFWSKTEFFNRAIKEGEKPVVIHYSAMYDADFVIRKAIKALYSNKDICAPGGKNKFQWFLTKLFNHRFVMKTWMKMQKLDGTKEIRK